MRRKTVFASAVAIVALAIALAPANGALAQSGEGATKRIQFVGQKKKKATPRRAPTRIVVRRALPYYLEASEFPRVDDVSWPGPNAVRECTAWLTREHRPSGTVVVPRQRCWWQPK
jgi:hypothetical protein